MDKIIEAAAEIRAAFNVHGFPEDFLRDFDQDECLNSVYGSETFLVTEKSTGRKCTAKCFDKAVYSFEDNHDILSELDHPGIPEAVAVYENDNMICFIREFIDGIPLSEAAKEKELSQEEIVKIALELTDILSYIHGRKPPVIHRDIKPDNIILMDDDRICLIDFDTARQVKADEEKDTVFFGTRGYAPPEQYGFRQTDARSDIYSFGVLLRFLLTDSVRENSKIRIYRPLQKIIDKCTAFSPDARYRSIDDVRRDLLDANPDAQIKKFLARAALAVFCIAAITAAGIFVYKQATYSPYKDGSIVASVMPDEERQKEAVSYMQDKFGTHIFDDREAYFTMKMLRDTLIEVYGMDRDYVYAYDTEEPPDESTEWFLPWPIDDYQYVDRDYMAYCVTKVYWPDVVTDWSSIKDDNGEFPSVRIAMKWCDDHDILLGVNRPKDLSCGEAATAFANADKVYEAMKKMDE
ncbi:MAG: serine/threonine protein kinase [Eubacterium sp.]|nr:serine/threonine protein kinase [Eubacterium sp.]